VASRAEIDAKNLIGGNAGRFELLARARPSVEKPVTGMSFG